MSPAFSSFAAFLNMGGYAQYVWLAVAVAVAAFGLLTVHTPGEIIYGKTETRALPHTGQRLRVGGYVQPGSLQRDPQTLDVRFKLYDARGVVDVSYKGILPDLFREGQGVVAQGVLDGERHITAQQVLAKHDENYTPPEVKNAMTPEKTGAQP